MEKTIKYGCGLSDTECFTDEFDSVDELIAFAQDAHDNPDGNYWDEDWDDDDYPHSIHVGTIEHFTAIDYMPSLGDIADQMTDKLYSDHAFDDDSEVSFYPRKEAEEAWKNFITKFCNMPYTCACHWNVGIYDLKEHKWTKRFDNKPLKQ